MDYFKGKSWKSITREERLFCAYLYFDIKKDVNKFIYWINEQLNLKLEEDKKWEPGYEVCFYRDYLFNKGLSAKKESYPTKRTFDLCLFSENKMIIFEAKAQQGFKRKQVSDIEDDRGYLKKLIGIECDVIALISARYKENASKYSNNELLNRFDGVITWKEVYKKYNDGIYLRADNIYKPKLKND